MTAPQPTPARTLLRAVADTVRDAMIAIDGAGRIVLGNRRATELLPGREVVVGAPLDDALHVTDERTRGRVRLARVLGACGARSWESRDPLCVGPDDAPRSVQVTARAISLDAGWIIVLQDVTSERMVEQQRQRADRLKAVGTLAAGIAHDFNDLLATMMNATDVARRRARRGDDVGPPLRQIDSACERLAALTRQLATFAVGPSPLRATIELAPVIRASADFALRGSNVRAELSVAADLWLVDGDAGQIGQVVNSLVLNAREAMPRGGTVQVTAVNRTVADGEPVVVPPDRYVEVRVRDHGHGIPEDRLARVFDPYFTTKPDGAGLGLTTAYAIARNHGGLLTLESSGKGGAVAVLLLPAARGQEATAGLELPNPAGGRALVMDDDELVRDSLCEVLRELGHRAEPARDGEHAVAMYEAALDAGDPFDFALLDLTVPAAMGGAEAARRMRAIDAAARCIGMTSNADAVDAPAGASPYFAGLVLKPFTVDQLTHAREANSQPPRGRTRRRRDRPAFGRCRRSASCCRSRRRRTGRRRRGRR